MKHLHPNAVGERAVKIKTSRKLMINGETVHPGSIRDLDDLTARKLLDRGYVVVVENEVQEEEVEDGSTAD